MSTGQLNPSPWLLADIGATNARLGVMTRADAPITALGTWPTQDFDNLAALIHAVLAQSPALAPRTLACALASPIHGDQVTLTNAGWQFSIEATRQALGLDRLVVINDWVAQGWLIAGDQPDGIDTLHPGEAMASAPRLALGPGTGLGSALVTPYGQNDAVFATEGGHISFAPATAREARVVAAIQSTYGHCSAERVASGLGLETLDAVLRSLDGRVAEGLEAKAVQQAAAAGDTSAREAIALMTQALGSVAGDLALATGARGGIYWGGGLIPALGEQFNWAALLERFQAKGRFRDYLAAIPHYLITADQPALRGLSRYLAASAHQARISARTA